MSEYPDNVAKGGYPKDPDMPDNVEAIYVSTKNTWQDAENLDNVHGYNSYVWVPEETYSIPIIKMHVYAEKFRAYETGAAAGGGTTQTSTTANWSHSHTVTGQTAQNSGLHGHYLVGGEENRTTGTHQLTATEMPVHSHGGVTVGGSSTDFAGGNGSHTHTYKDLYSTSTEMGGTHDHTVTGVTSSEAAWNHSHSVTLPDHTHTISFGIYEEAIAGRTLSAKLYDPDGNLLHDFGVLVTGEGDIEIDLKTYFATLKYGMYKLELSASGRLRARIIFYELNVMYAI